MNTKIIEDLMSLSVAKSNLLMRAQLPFEAFNDLLTYIKTTDVTCAELQIELDRAPRAVTDVQNSTYLYRIYAIK